VHAAAQQRAGGLKYKSLMALKCVDVSDILRNVRLFVTALVKGLAAGEAFTEDEHDVGCVDVDEILVADARGARLIPCNVLDLASFPPSITTSASIAATQA